MNFKRVFIVLSVVFAIAFTLVFATACKDKTVNGDTYSGAEFENDAKSSFATTYNELSATKVNNNQIWRNGMVTGNGRQGAIIAGSPYNDTVIFQNIHFILPNKNPRENPVSYDELETVRQNIINGRDITDDQPYMDVYSYHAGAILRMAQTGKTAAETEPSEYMRYTDYDTAQVGTRYTDGDGQWDRLTFTSKADDVTITQLTASSTGVKLNVTFSYDSLSTMPNFGKEGDVYPSEKDIRYKRTTDDNLEYLGFVAHYPPYEGSELKDGGYATVSYIFCEGGTKELVTVEGKEEEQFVGDEITGIKITGAKKIYVITASDRTYDMGAYDEFAEQESYDLETALREKVKAVADKYTRDGVFYYSEALKSHTDIFTPQYNAVEFSLGADISVPNEDLTSYKFNNNTINNTLAERAYYSGRYAYLCCAGTSTSRLFGMWTGEWVRDWGSKYTMDANVNLQTSSMNTGNISDAYVGYVNFILRQVDDWMDNAYASHGYEDAIQAPVNSDGDMALLTESCYPYPFRYWNAGASWMLQPLYETLMCYGDVKIPLSEEFDLQDLRAVLSMTNVPLTDAKVAEIKEKGYLDLRSEILLPLLLKSANYWDQLMVPQYYTDANGDIHYEEGKTSLAEGETYCIIPSYSPENNPSNYPSPSCANSAIDIAACRNNLEMLIEIWRSVDPTADVSKWESLMEKLPPYLYDESGAIKEWAANQFEENNTHRHLSHMYMVWPLFETQDDEALRDAAIQAIENRASENEASHALIHRALIAARLKDRDSVTDSLVGLMNGYTEEFSLRINTIYYNSLMTNHHTNRGSCYCTDFAIGYLGMINEALVYSYTGKIEVLPALPTSGFDEGYIKGIKCRTRAEVTNLSWSLKTGKASVTVKSDIDQTIEISCGLSSKTEKVTLKAGESVTVEFDIKG